MFMFSQKKFLAACLGFAAISTIIFASSHPTLRRPVKVTYQQTIIKPDGTCVTGAIYVRILADGQMRRKEYRNGKLYADQYVNTDGELFGVSHKRRELNPANFPHKFDLRRPPETAESMMSQSQYHRTEQLLGITVYVFRIYDDNGRLSNETWKAPETDPLPLKEISYIDNGMQYVMEATSVEYDNVGEVRPARYKVK